MTPKISTASLSRLLIMFVVLSARSGFEWASNQKKLVIMEESTQDGSFDEPTSYFTIDGWNMYYNSDNTGLVIGNPELLSAECFKKEFHDPKSFRNCLVEHNVAGSARDTLNERELVIPDNINISGKMFPIEKIQKGAFIGFKNLEIITIPAGVTILDDYTFFDIGNLKEIHYEGQRNLIFGKYAFEGTQKSIKISYNNLKIKENMKELQSKDENSDKKKKYHNFYYDLTNGILRVWGVPNLIEYDSFDINSNDVEEVILQDLYDIGDWAFDHWTNLRKIGPYENIKSLGIGAFGYTSIQEFEFKYSSTTIPNSLFQKCRKLKKVILSSSQYIFDKWCFTGCSSLEEFKYSSNTKPTFKDHSFHEVNQILKTVDISNYPINGVSMKFNFQEGGCHVNVSVPKTETTIKYTTIDSFAQTFNVFTQLSNLILKSITFIDGSATLSDFKSIHSLESVIFMTNDISDVNSNAFQDCINLKKVILPKNLKKVGISSFENTNITDIYIPFCAHIDNYCFKSCKSLKKIVISGVSNCIGVDAFSNCISLSDVYYMSPNHPKGCATMRVFSPEYLKNVTVHVTPTYVNSTFFEKDEVDRDDNVFIAQGGALNYSFSIVDTECVINGNGIVYQEEFRLSSKKCMRCSSFADISKIKFINSDMNCHPLAFDGCDKLTDVYITNSFVKFYSQAFHNCINLKNIFICQKFNPSSNSHKNIPIFTSDTEDYSPNIVVKTVSNSEINSFYGITTIDKTANIYVSEQNIRYIYIENSVEIIGTITSSFVNNIVQYQSNIACECTKQLVSDLIFSGDNEIAFHINGVFENNDNIKSVVFKNTGKTTLSTRSFKNCRHLSKVILPKNVVQIGIETFAGTAIREISVPQCKYFDNSSFQNCNQLVTIFIQGFIQGFAHNVFRNCFSLKNLYYFGNTEPFNPYTSETNKHPLIFTADSPTNSIADNVTVYVTKQYSTNSFYEKTSMTLFDKIYQKNNGALNLSAINSELTIDGTGEISNEDVVKASGLDFSLELLGRIVKIIFNNCQEISLSEKSFDGLENLQIIEIKTGTITFGKSAFNNCYNLKYICTNINTPPSYSEEVFSSDQGTIHVTIFVNNEYTDEQFCGHPVNKSMITVVDSLEYVITDETVKINGNIDSTWSGMLIISEQINSFNCQCKNNEIKSLIFIGNNEYKAGLFKDNKVIIKVDMSQSNYGKLNSQMFQNCESLSEVLLPKKVEIIGESAFENTKISEIDIPANVTSIDSYSFKNCAELTTVRIRGNIIKGFGNYTFMGCDKLQTFYFFGNSNPVPQSNYKTFIFTDQSTEEYFGADIELYVPTDYDNNSFAEKTENITHGINIYKTNNGNLLFEYHDLNLKVSGIGEINENDIDTSSKNNCAICYDRTKIVFADINGEITLAQNAFNSCSSISRVNLQGVTDIGENTFHNCYDLKEIFYIGSLDFSSKNYNILTSDTGSLKDQVIIAVTPSYSYSKFFECDVTHDYPFTLINGITAIFKGTSASFSGKGKLTVDTNLIQSEYEKIFSNTEKWHFTEISFDGDIDVVISENGFLNNPDLISVSFNNVKSVTILNHAFDGCSKLNKLILPESYIKVLTGIYSFQNTAFKELVLVHAIYDNYTFASCNQLQKIIMKSDPSFGLGVFYGCYQLTSVLYDSRIPPQSYYSDLPLHIFTTKISENIDEVGYYGDNITMRALYQYTDDSFAEIPSINKDLDMLTTNDGKLSYLSNGNTLTIIGEGISNEEDLNEFISIEYNSINSRDDILTININTSSITIKEYTFSNCSNLKTAIINSYVIFGNNAFHNCYSLADLYYCSSSIQADSHNITLFTSDDLDRPILVTIHVTPLFKQTTFFEIAQPKKYHSIINKDNIRYEFFDDIYEVDISGSIDIHNFAGISNIEAAYNLAICQCSTLSIKRIVFSGDNTINLTSNAFNGDTELESVVFKNLKETTIGANAFVNCSSLSQVVFTNDINTIGSYAFYGIRIKEILIPYVKNYIDEYAFKNCHELEHVSMKGMEKGFAKGSFENCYSLRTFFYFGLFAPSNPHTDQPNAIFTTEDPSDSFIDKVIVYVTKDYPANTLCDKTQLTIIEINIYQKDGVTMSRSGSAISITGSGKLDHSDIVQFSRYFEYTGTLDEIGKITFNNANIELSSETFRDCTSMPSVDVIKGFVSFGNRTFHNCLSLKNINLFMPYIQTFDHDTYLFTKDDGNFASQVTIKLATDYRSGSFAECTNLDRTTNEKSFGKTSYIYYFNNFTYQISPMEFWQSFDLTPPRDAYNEWNSQNNGFYNIEYPPLNVIFSGNNVEILFKSGTNNLYLTNKVQSIEFIHTYSSFVVQNECYKDLKSLTKFIFPNCPTITIGKNAFTNTSVPEFIIRATKCTIGNYAFSDCPELKIIELSQGVSFGECVFQNSDNLREVRFIGNTAPGFKELYPIFSYRNETSFSDRVNVRVPYNYNGDNFADKNNVNKDLNSIYIGNENITFHEDKMFINGSTKITKDNLSYALIRQVSISCYNLRDIVHVVLIGDIELDTELFYDWNFLANIEMVEGFSKLGVRSFSRTPIASIEFPTTVHIIPDELLAGCPNLTTVTIRGNVHFGKDVFKDCDKLKEINYCNIVPPTIDEGEILINEGQEVKIYVATGYSSSSFCNITELNLNANFYEYSKGEEFMNIIFDNGKMTIGGDGNLTKEVMDTALSSNQHCLCNIDRYSIDFIEIQNSTVILGEYTFAGMSNLRDFKLANGPEVLERYCFQSCGLINISLPSSYTVYSEGVFDSCTKLLYVHIDSKVNFEPWVFNNCPSLLSIYYCPTEIPLFSNLSDEVESSVFGVGKIPSKPTIFVTTIYESTQFLGLDVNKTANQVTINENTYLVENLVLTIKGRSEITQNDIDYIGGNPKCIKCGGKANIKEIYINSPVVIGESAFEGITNLKSIIMNDDTSIIKSKAIAKSGLTTFVFPKMVSEINSSLFYDCGSLESVEFISSAEFLFDDVFINCKSLVEVIYCGDTVENADLNLFPNSPNVVVYLKSYVDIKSFGKAKTIIRDANIIQESSRILTFNKTHMSVTGSGTLSSTLIDLSKLKCLDCNNINELESIFIGKTIIIGDSGLSNLHRLKTLTLEEGFTSINAFALTNDISLASVTFPKSVSSIPEQVFLGCSGLVSVKFQSIIEFGYDVFKGCTSLQTIDYCSSKPPEGKLIVEDKVKIYVPSNYESNSFALVTKNLFNSANSFFIPSAENPKINMTIIGKSLYISGEGNIDKGIIDEFIGSNTHCLTCLERSSIERVEASDQIVIGDYALEGINLKDFNISNTTDEINEGSFKDTQIEKVVIPPNVVTVGKKAFEGCKSLIVVTFVIKLPKLLEEKSIQIGEDAFRDCHNLKTIYYCSSDPVESKNVFTFSDISLKPNPAIYVQTGYNSSEFCEKPVLKKLDNDCHVIEDESEENKPILGTGALAGTVVAVIVVVAVIIVVIIIILKKKNSDDKSNDNEEEPDETYIYNGDSGIGDTQLHTFVSQEATQENPIWTQRAEKDEDQEQFFSSGFEEEEFKILYD